MCNVYVDVHVQFPNYENFLHKHTKPFQMHICAVIQTFIVRIQKSIFEKQNGCNRFRRRQENRNERNRFTDFRRTQIHNSTKTRVNEQILRTAI